MVEVRPSIEETESYLKGNEKLFRKCRYGDKNMFLCHFALLYAPQCCRKEGSPEPFQDFNHEDT